MDIADFSSLGSMPEAEPEPESAIHKLRPGSELHSKTLGKLQNMFRYSEQSMNQHTPRWGWMEQKIQAYIALPDYKQLTTQLENNRGAAPEPVFTRRLIPRRDATAKEHLNGIYAPSNASSADGRASSSCRWTDGYC